jgi:CubicO group peptidase (beta-lactamase class C family)
VNQDALIRIAALVSDRPGKAQLHVLSHGTPVLDVSVRCEPETPFLLWSTGKPFTAMAVHQLAERGLLDLDAPIAAHWPEYGRAGKGSVTPRHALTHTTGVPLSTRHVVGDAWAGPEYGLVFAYLTNRMVPRAQALPWQTEVGDLVRAAVSG